MMIKVYYFNFNLSKILGASAPLVEKYSLDLTGSNDIIINNNNDSDYDTIKRLKRASFLLNKKII